MFRFAKVKVGLRRVKIRPKAEIRFAFGKVKVNFLAKLGNYHFIKKYFSPSAKSYHNFAAGES